MRHFSRRHICALGLAGLATPRLGYAAAAREITWDDLIPAGVPYAEIVGEGEMDFVQDTWKPVYDENALKLNEDLDGATIRMPGFILPLEYNDQGVTEFVLVPYVGACIHTPPPPPNQLVFVTASKPWPTDQQWDAVWVEGRMSTRITTTELAETGYSLKADLIELYQWD